MAMNNCLMEAVPFANPTLKDALSELFTKCETLEPPEIVTNLIIAVLEKPLKLFCLVGEDSSTERIGTARLSPGLYASDLFVKLLAAVRALQWEVVVIILEQALSPLTPTPPAEDRR